MDGPTRHRPPGTQQPRRFRPRFHWELLVCGIEGHELIGTDAAELRSEDAVYARELGGLRWFRCVRCDSWLPVERPPEPAREAPPPREEIDLPLRGRALRDRVVLRLIAIDRAIHFGVLAVLAVAVFLFASHLTRLRSVFYRVVDAIQGTSGGPAHHASGGFFEELRRLVSLQSSTLYLVAAAAAGYALIECAEAIGLWYQRRWAEYLTFVATILLLPLEIYELTKTLSPLKIVALVINLAIAAYLLLAKRLFGLRGGAATEREERERDSGWEALERTAPGPTLSSAPPSASSESGDDV
ncbi:MAG: DUF2127 domain-containing protein [Gaiellaceae bacterium]